MRVRHALLALACVTASAASRADVIASNNGTTIAGTFEGYYDGQSFTVGGSGAYHDIVFNFVGSGTGSFGTAFLLSQEYAGTPGNLNSSTSGFLASTSANGQSITFDSGLTLQGGTTYYLFTNGVAGVNGTAQPNGNYYYYSQGGSFFKSDSYSTLYTVTGDALPSVSATPEPSSLILLATGMAGAMGAIRRRRS